MEHYYIIEYVLTWKYPICRCTIDWNQLWKGNEPLKSEMCFKIDFLVHAFASTGTALVVWVLKFMTSQKKWKEKLYVLGFEFKGRHAIQNKTD